MSVLRADPCPDCLIGTTVYDVVHDTLTCNNHNCRRYSFGQHRQASSQAHGGASPLSDLGARAQAQAAAQQLSQHIAGSGAIGQAGAGQSGPSQSIGLGPFWINESPVAKLIPSAGITVGELLGWRCWRLTEKGFLQSGYKDTIWIPGVPMTGDPNKTSAEGIEGVYAFKDLSDKVHKAADEYSCTTAVAIGTVALWGTVIEHEFGYRAEFAQVKSIEGLVGVPLAEYSQRIELLRSTYCLAHTEHKRKPKQQRKQ